MSCRRTHLLRMDGAPESSKIMESQGEIVIINIGSRSWRFPGSEIDLNSEFECRGDGKLYLHDDSGAVIEGIEVDEPEDISGELAISLPEERRRRELQLARVMLSAVDLIVSGEGLGLESGRDLIREIEHTFPELVIQPRSGWEELLDEGTSTLIAETWVENARSSLSTSPLKEQANQDGHKARKP